jgi:hypothetical protein
MVVTVLQSCFLGVFLRAAPQGVSDLPTVRHRKRLERGQSQEGAEFLMTAGLTPRLQREEGSGKQKDAVQS